MRIPKPAGREESHALESAFDSIRRDWGLHHKFQFTDILLRWERFVVDIDDGYPLGIDSYTQELSLRDELDALAGLVPPRLAAEIADALRGADSQFVAVTQPIDEPLLPPVDGEALSSRWYRIPCRISPGDDEVARTWANHTKLMLLL